MTGNDRYIPKKLHYCWYGGKPLNRRAEKCIESWKKFCPDFEILRWDESNSDMQENRYVREAYQSKKWAFVSDYFRLKAVYENGGVYLDTDVELIKPLEGFLDCGGFMGFEDRVNVATCIMGGVRGHLFFRRALETYRSRAFLLDNGECDTTTNVEFLTRLLVDNGLVQNGERQSVMDMDIFPNDYFSPKSLVTGKITLTENTHAIHRFEASWQTGKQRFHTKAAQILGEKNTECLKRLMGKK